MQDVGKNWAPLRSERFADGRASVLAPLWPHFVMGLFGGGWALAFDVGVRVYAAELVAIGCFLILPWWSTLRRYIVAQRILFAYVIWILAVVLADVVNATELGRSYRHIATPVLGAVSLIAVVVALSANPRAIFTFLASTAIAKGVWGEPGYGDVFDDIAVTLESVFGVLNFFKVRIEPVLTPMIVLIACWAARRSLTLSTILLFFAGLFYLTVDARAAALVFLLASAGVYVAASGFQFSRSRVATLGFALAVFGYIGYVGYVYYTLGFNADGQGGRQLLAVKNPYNPIAAVAQGRSEWLVIPEAILERPVFGWGSWADDEDLRFAYLRADRLGVDDYSRIANLPTSPYIPAHSLVGSAWLWSGLLALVAMFMLLGRVWSMGRFFSSVPVVYLPAVMFMFVQFNWHYFFSPPQVVRIAFPVSLGLLIVVTSVAVYRTRPLGRVDSQSIHSREAATATKETKRAASLS